MRRELTEAEKLAIDWVCNNCFGRKDITVLVGGATTIVKLPPSYCLSLDSRLELREAKVTVTGGILAPDPF